MNPTFTLAGSRQPFATVRIFRDRVYRAYGVKQQPCGAHFRDTILGHPILSIRMSGENSVELSHRSRDPEAFLKDQGLLLSSRETQNGGEARGDSFETEVQRLLRDFLQETLSSRNVFGSALDLDKGARRLQNHVAGTDVQVSTADTEQKSKLSILAALSVLIASHTRAETAEKLERSAPGSAATRWHPIVWYHSVRQEAALHLRRDLRITFILNKRFDRQSPTNLESIMAVINFFEANFSFENIRKNLRTKTRGSLSGDASHDNSAPGQGSAGAQADEHADDQPISVLDRVLLAQFANMAKFGEQPVAKSNGYDFDLVENLSKEEIESLLWSLVEDFHFANPSNNQEGWACRYAHEDPVEAKKNGNGAQAGLETAKRFSGCSLLAFYAELMDWSKLSFADQLRTSQVPDRTSLFFII